MLTVSPNAEKVEITVLCDALESEFWWPLGGHLEAPLGPAEM